MGNLRNIFGLQGEQCKKQIKEEKKKQFLSDYPALVRQWHPTKNGTEKPENYKYKSNRKIWWKCPEGDDHEWQAVIANRTGNKTGCPCCDGRKVSKTNSLSTKFPDIAKLWHPIKNMGMKPKDYTYGSHQKVWWKCPKCNHEWEALINSKTNEKTGCIACTNRVVTSTNNLQYLFPEIVKEWHPIKNDDLRPDQIVAGSNRKIWWKCLECDHEWETTIVKRTRNKSSCPICNDTTKMRPKWQGWEKVGEEIIRYLYPDSFRIQPNTRLSNNKIPDLQYKENDIIVIADCKTHPYKEKSIEEDIKNYLPYCDRLEFWCLEREREPEIRDGKEVWFINVDTLLLPIKNTNIKLYKDFKLRISELKNWKYKDGYARF